MQHLFNCFGYNSANTKIERLNTLLITLLSHNRVLGPMSEKNNIVNNPCIVAGTSVASSSVYCVTANVVFVFTHMHTLMVENPIGKQI